MAEPSKAKVNRRSFLKKTYAAAGLGVAAAGAVGAGSYWLGSVSRVSRAAGKKVIVIGIDGMDPRLSESMMQEGLLPNLAKLQGRNGFRRRQVEHRTVRLGSGSG